MRKRILSIIIAFVIGTLIVPVLIFGGEAIQTQPSSDGNFEVTLTSVKIRKEVLTINFRIKNTSSKNTRMSFKYEDLYYADVDNKKKYFILKDSEGKYIAGPNYLSGSRFKFDIDSGGQKIAWAKFPAPSETTKSIDIFIPGVLPFEEIKIVR